MSIVVENDARGGVTVWLDRPAKRNALDEATLVALRNLGAGGPHGLSEIIYAYASSVADNGSAFAGLNANTPWYNVTTGVAMFFGRFAHAIPILAIAGSLAAKKKVAPSPGTLPTDGPLFIAFLLGVIAVITLLPNISSSRNSPSRSLSATSTVSPCPSGSADGSSVAVSANAAAGSRRSAARNWKQHLPRRRRANRRQGGGGAAKEGGHEQKGGIARLNVETLQTRTIPHPEGTSPGKPRTLVGEFPTSN